MGERKVNFREILGKLEDAIEKRNFERLKKLNYKNLVEQETIKLVRDNPEYELITRQSHIKRCGECKGVVRKVFYRDRYINISINDEHLTYQVLKFSKFFCARHYNRIDMNCMKEHRKFRLSKEICVLCYIEMLEKTIVELSDKEVKCQE